MYAENLIKHQTLKSFVLYTLAAQTCLRPPTQSVKCSILPVKTLRVTVQQGHRAFHTESRLSSIPRIEIQGFAEPLGKRFVSMTKDDHIRPLASDTLLQNLCQVMRRDNVMDEKLKSRELDNASFRIIETGIIGVAGDRRDGRDFFQAQNNARQADIPGMNYM